jgi:peptide-methionine (R)-S-oxide reductase
LFDSETKFNSGTDGLVLCSFKQKNRVKEVVDNSLGMVRGEIVCSVRTFRTPFDDGPNPTGLRYCMNSAAMLFKESK